MPQGKKLLHISPFRCMYRRGKCPITTEKKVLLESRVSKKVTKCVILEIERKLAIHTNTVMNKLSEKGLLVIKRVFVYQKCYRRAKRLGVNSGELNLSEKSLCFLQKFHFLFFLQGCKCKNEKERNTNNVFLRKNSGWSFTFYNEKTWDAREVQLRRLTKRVSLEATWNLIFKISAVSSGSGAEFVVQGPQNVNSKRLDTKISIPSVFFGNSVIWHNWIWHNSF